MAKVRGFVDSVGATGGGDAPEAYELALLKAQKEMGWGPRSRRLMVMVGDATPHEPGYTCNGYTNTIDWRVQLAALSKKKVRVMAVQAGGGGDNGFWGRLASETGGQRLSIREMSTVPVVVMATIARELGPDAFVAYGERLKAQGRMRGEAQTVYETIKITISRTG